MLNAKSQLNLTVAARPPMGLNTWNRTRDHYNAYGNFDIVNEQFVCQQADALVATGMRDAGYTYLVIDDCWEAMERDAAGDLQADPEKFPHGMKAVADYVKAHGLEFGIYTCAGSHTCQGYPASYGNEFRDAALFVKKWGARFIKVDWCNTCEGLDAKKQYTIWRDAILATGENVVLSICEWGKDRNPCSKPWKWGKGVGHMWRTTGDRQPTRESFLYILDAQKGLERYAGPGHFNDADILEVGNCNFTDEENRAQFSMWCILATPLFAGNDITKMSQEIRSILIAREVIAVNQDPAGIQGTCVYSKRSPSINYDIWAKRLGPPRHKAYAVTILNRDEKGMLITLSFKDMGWDYFSRVHVRDLWREKDLSEFTGSMPIFVPSNGVRMLRLRLL